MPNSASQAMQTLTEQYYNVLTTQLHLDPNEFQLVQGNVALGATSQGLWAVMDSIPPFSLTQYWTPSGYNSFSSNYGSVLSRIQSSASGAFLTAMGDYYNAWVSYLKTNPLPAGTNLPTYFQNWAMSSGMPPQQAQSVTSLYLAAFSDPVVKAQQLWLGAGGAGSVMAYGTSIETADAQIGMAPSGSVSLDSATQSSDVSHTWASGSVEGFYDVFFGEAGSSYDASTSLVTNAGIEMTISFTHVATLPVAPLSQGSQVAGPTTYLAWYVSAALQNAYNNNNYNTWQSGSPNWQSFFGDSGSMLRALAALIVVDGIKISLTTTNGISKADQQQVQASFEAGFFPFFGISGQGGWSNSFAYDDQGRIAATSSCPTGSPQILGVLVVGIANLIASGDVAEARRFLRAVSAPPLRSSPRQESVAVGAPLVVTVAWSAVALQGLHQLGVSAPIEQLIAAWVSTWATNNAGGWALGTLHQYPSAHPQYTATAQVTAIHGGNRSVTIVNFV